MGLSLTEKILQGHLVNYNQKMIAVAIYENIVNRAAEKLICRVIFRGIMSTVQLLQCSLHLLFKICPLLFISPDMLFMF